MSLVTNHGYWQSRRIHHNHSGIQRWKRTHTIQLPEGNTYVVDGSLRCPRGKSHLTNSYLLKASVLIGQVFQRGSKKERRLMFTTCTDSRPRARLNHRKVLVRRGTREWTMNSCYNDIFPRAARATPASTLRSCIHRVASLP